MGKTENKQNRSIKKQVNFTLTNKENYANSGIYQLEDNADFLLLAQQALQQIKKLPHDNYNLYIKITIQNKQLHIQACLNDDKQQKPIRSSYTLIHNVQQFLLSNIKDPPSLVQLAHRFGTNEKKLNQQFKQITNMTVFSWIREQRMQKSLSLLQTKGMTVQQTAKDCGFKHQSDFCTSFKKRFQLTPMAFKRQIICS